MLEIRNLTKIYKGEVRAVDNVSLTVNPGDIFGFIGHNGAGKTTTIKCIAGILQFNQGEIFINGLNNKEEPIECKKVTAYIPDNPDIYEHLTGYKYLNFIADVFGLSLNERGKNIHYYSELFEFADHLNETINSYSHGMKQKLVLIAAFIHKPKLMLLDEPFVGLDPKASYTLKQLLKEVCSDGGAVFFSTHILEVAQKLCNKIAIIKGGKIIESGNTEEVCRNSSLEDIFLELYNE